MIKYLKDNQKVIATFWIAIVITFFFLEPLSELFLKLGSLFKTENKSFQIGYWVLVAFIIVFYGNKIVKRYIFSKNTTFFVMYFTAVYLVFRFACTESIQFTKLYNSIAYVDVVMIMVVIFHILGLLRISSKHISSFIDFFKRNGKKFIDKLKKILKSLKDYFKEKNKKEEENKKNDKEDKNTFFIEDTILEDEERTIDNELILQKLISRVSHFKPQNAFSIGLNASWGYGKSTFLARFEKKYKEKHSKEIIFWYRIWKNKGEKAIIENFFAELKKELAPFSGEISNTIDKYVSAILRLSNSDIVKLIEVGKSLLEEHETLEEFYEGINKTIKKIDKQVIILLDDLDRLETKEILNTLKLIRTLSDFNNVIFIAGYDREYVVEKTQESTVKTNYLDKAFNVEINLLPFNVKSIDDELFRLVDKVFPNEANEADTNIFNVGFSNLFQNLKEQPITEVDPSSLETLLGNNDSEKRCEAKFDFNYQTFLPTYRDIKRFLNEFKFYASFIEEKKVGNRTDVIVSEFILLKLLIYKYRDVTTKILNRIDKFMEDEHVDFEGITGYFGSKGNIYVYKKSEEELKKHFPNYDDRDIAVINSVLCRLFGRKQNDFYKKNFNSISKVYYTDLYIKNTILSDAIFTTELEDALNKNKLYELVTKLVDKIILTKNYGLTNEIKYFVFGSFVAVDTKEKFLDVLKTLQVLLGRVHHNDNVTILKFLTTGKKEYYSNDNSGFKDVISSVVNQSESKGVLDFLFSDININSKRIKSGLYNSSEVVIYTDLPLKEDEMESIYVSKLSHLVSSRSNCNLVYLYYILKFEGIIFDKKIVFSVKGSKIIKKDIKDRFKAYFEADFFKTVRERISEHDGIRGGHQPFFMLAQIFSEEETVKELVEKPNDEELYKKFNKEGWTNFNEFLNEQIEKLQEDSDFMKLEQLKKGQKFVEAYIEKGCIALAKQDYDEIWEN